jgi:hypothetical protein
MNFIKALVLTLCLAATTNPARACSCSGTALSDRDAAAEEFDAARAVFTGEVISVKTMIDADETGLGLTKFSFRVIQSFKGDSGSIVRVFSSMERTDCATGMKVADRLFVYAFEGKDGRLYVGHCDRTSSLEFAGADLRFALGEPATAEDRVPADERLRLLLEPDLKAKGATLSGQVRWPEKATRGDTFITIWEVDEQGRRLDSRLAVQKVDPDGRFEIRYVKPGNCFVSVADSRLGVPPKYVGILGLVSLPERATLVGQDVTLHAEPLGTVTIRVIAASIPRERVFVDLRDVELDLENPGSSPFQFGTEKSADSDGVATFKQIPYGHYNVSVGLYNENLEKPSWTHDDATVTLDGPTAELSIQMYQNHSN